MRTAHLPLIALTLLTATVSAQPTSTAPIASRLTTAVRTELGAPDSTAIVQCTMAQWHTGAAGTGSALVMHQAPRVWAGASCTWLPANGAAPTSTEVLYATAADADEAVEALATRIAERLRQEGSGPKPEVLERELARGN